MTSLTNVRARPSIRHALARLTAVGFVAALAWPAAAQTLAVKLIDPAGTAALMNERGDVVGSHMIRPCAVPFNCAPVDEPSVWTASGRKVLPTQGSLIVAAAAIANDGMVVGTLTDFNVTSKAVVWRLVNGAYQITELGNLGLAQSSATGIDASGRVVGYAITPFVSTRPFVWTAAGGMQDLAANGAPAERIHSVSPGGRVVTDSFTFHLNNPAAAQRLPAPPVGGPAFGPTFGANFRINDGGDLGGFHLTTSSNPAYFLHRYRVATGSWQLLDPNGIVSGSGLAVGVGRIDAQSTIGATLGRAVLALGPAGLATPLTDRLSPAYPPNSLASLGYFDDQGVILSNVVIGGVARAAKLLPIAPCVGACLRVPSIQMTSKYVRSTPRSNCGVPQCYVVTAVVQVTDVSGNPQSKVRVAARFMSGYGLDAPVSGQTNASGLVTFVQKGPAGVGTISLIVESAERAGWNFDMGVGQLTGEVVALP
jgi:hypothetical protein